MKYYKWSFRWVQKHGYCTFLACTAGTLSAMYIKISYELLQWTKGQHGLTFPCGREQNFFFLSWTKLDYYWLVNERTHLYSSHVCVNYSVRAASPGPDSGCFVWWAGQEWHSLLDPIEKGLVWKANESHAHRHFCGYVRLVLQKRKKTCFSILFLWLCAKVAASNLIFTPTLMICSPP